MVQLQRMGQAGGNLLPIPGERPAVYVEGRLKSRTYQAQNGETRFSNEVTVSEVQFLGGQRGASEVEPGRDGDDLGDLPF